MSQPFEGNQISFVINDDQSEIAFTVVDAAPGTTVQDVSFLGSKFIYSVLGAGPSARSNGGQVNEDGSVTAKFRV